VGIPYKATDSCVEGSAPAPELEKTSVMRRILRKRKKNLEFKGKPVFLFTGGSLSC